ncbi:MAG: AraC family transcriptional regulator [Candidatus Afipia apatlaquensis]|uniref:AraC family transcriptional regulator n=1 Tax=Candidatus Afipia apatlaquensis TaxID=2712852 RepID=A0A7C9VGF8_9BRAD|nr:AraC family transcriptional regulator [Candidatus Afipia apatlaquensis]
MRTSVLNPEAWRQAATGRPGPSSGLRRPTSGFQTPQARLSTALGVSHRSLYRAFAEVLGIAPIMYLRHRRLCEAQPSAAERELRDRHRHCIRQGKSSQPDYRRLPHSRQRELSCWRTRFPKHDLAG